MCVLCEQEALYRLGVGAPIQIHHALSTVNQLPTRVLVDEQNASYSKRLTASDQLMTLYLHAAGGSVQVNAGGFGVQTIESMAIPLEDQTYLASLTSRLERLIDLDFAFVQSPDAADISIYYDTEILLDEAAEILGLAVPRSGGWNLFLNYPEVWSDLSYRRYILAHELGHSLGLEHPFESRDGDVFSGITDPWSSAYPEDTVMAYRSPLRGVWPEYFSEADLRALAQIWGEHPEVYGDGSDRVVGLIGDESFDLAGGDDWIQAGFGDDDVNGGSGSDEIYGNQGQDTLLGGIGNDKIYGGKDDDQLFGNQGQDLILGNVGDDFIFGGKENDRLFGNQGEDYLFGNRGNDAIWAGQSNDWIDGGEGGDWLWGNTGADRFYLSSGNDVIYDFSAVEGDRLELTGSQALNYEQIGYDLLVYHSMGTVMLMNVVYGVSFFGESEINRV